LTVWQITADAIGTDDNGAAYFPTKREAQQAIAEYREWIGEASADVDLRKIVVRNADDLCRELTHAMGFGAS
jgi:hypothetical protein